MFEDANKVRDMHTSTRDAIEKDGPIGVGTEDAKKLEQVEHGGESEDALPPLHEEDADANDPAAKFLRGEQVSEDDLNTLKRKLEGKN